MSNKYEVIKRHNDGQEALERLDVIADDYEVEMCGAVTFFHINNERRKILSIAPGTWFRVVDVLNKP